MKAKLFLTQYDRRINLVGSLILITLILVTGIFVYTTMHRQSVRLLDMSLETLSQQEAQLLNSQIQAMVSDTKSISARFSLIDALQQINSQQGETDAIEKLEQYVNALLHNGFNSIAIYDYAGNNVVQAGPTTHELTESLSFEHESAMITLWWNERYIQRIQMEVFDQNSQQIGYIVTEKNQSLLTQSLYEIGAIGESGEFMLCTPWKEDGLMMECFLMNAAGVQFRRLSRVLADKALPMDYALRGESGVVTTGDYRQIRVVAAHAPVGEYGLGLVVKIDEEELYQPITARAKEIFFYIILLMVMALLLLNWQLMPLVRKFVRSEQEIEKVNANLLRSKEIIERNLSELTHYNEAVGKLALVSVADRKGLIIQANSKFCEVSGYNEEELIGQDHRILNSGIHPKVFWTEMWKTVSLGDTWHAEVCNRTKGGELYWVDTTIVPLRDSSGRIYRYLSVRVDISARKQKELTLCQQLKESNCLQIIRQAMDSELSVSKLCQHILAHLTVAVQYPEIASAKIELAGEQFVTDNYVEVFAQRLSAEIIVNGNNTGELQLCYLESKLFLFPEEQNLIDIIANDLGRWYERKLADQRISYLATHDNLTGLPNWHLLQDRIAQAIAHAGRHRKRAAILFIDLDRFKIINDSLGHEMGDLLLKETGIRLRSCVRAEDTVARQGGDEFVVLLQGISDHQSAGAVAKKILEAIKQPYPIGGKKLHIGCSIGIAIFPDDGENADILLKNSDIAMYHAKEIGRNNYQFFTADMNQQIMERHLLETDLRRAAERKEFQLYFQPVIDMPEQKLKSMEALLRWKHPKLGSVPPSKFILLAEETGMIISIGEWVLKEACLQIKAWQARGYQVPRVAINLSARQFRCKTLVADITRILNETGVSPSSLTLEITESMLIQNVDEAVEILTQLRLMGFELSIDDFGTGYSSLGYLKFYPINILKIDRSFIQNIVSEPNDAAIIAAILAMAKTLKVAVIAEGVETQEQVTFLVQQGCNRYQGFYFSEPLTAEELESKLCASQ